jgi:hypothetical protein
MSNFDQNWRYQNTPNSPLGNQTMIESHLVKTTFVILNKNVIGNLNVVTLMKKGHQNVENLMNHSMKVHFIKIDKIIFDKTFIEMIVRNNNKIFRVFLENRIFHQKDSIRQRRVREYQTIVETLTRNVDSIRMFVDRFEVDVEHLYHEDVVIIRMDR